MKECKRAEARSPKPLPQLSKARGGQRLAVHHSKAGRTKGQAVLVDGRTIGIVYGDTLRRVCQARHQLQQPPAWAFSVRGLLYAEGLGASKIEVKVTDTGSRYQADIVDVWRRGFRFNRGWGDQVALELKFWHAQLAGVDQRALL